MFVLHTCLHTDYRYEDREPLIEADSSDSSGEVQDICTVFPQIKAQMLNKILYSQPLIKTIHLFQRTNLNSSI